MKRKIIQFLRWILVHLDPILQIQLSVENKKIHRVRWSGIMYRWDVHNELKDQIARKIAAELSKNNMINTEVTQSAPGYNDEYKVTAEILVIEPKPER